MSLPDSRIVEFINEHHVLTLATCVDNKPWCSNCFYVYLAEENVLIFTTDINTQHGQEAIKNSTVAGSIVLETNVVGKIQGIQFTGIMQRAEGDILKKAKAAYLKRFPMAMLMKTTLWALEITSLKMTDNRLGFGKKLLWP